MNIDVWIFQKLYKSTDKCDYQQQYKAILEPKMVSTLEGFTDNIPMLPGSLLNIKNPSARKSLRQFNKLLDVKKKTDVHQLGAAK